MNIFKFFLFNFSNVQFKRIFKNFTSQISLNISSTIIQIFFPPLMILVYGLENFGIWIFLTTIPLTFEILNFNINAAAKTEMSVYFNQKNKKKLCEIFTNSVFPSLFLIFFLIILSGLLIFFYDFNLNILQGLKNNDLNVILACVFIPFYLHLINSILITGITYSGKLYIDTYIQIIFDFFTKTLIISFGLIFENILFAAIAFLAGNILKTFVFYFYYLNCNKKIKLFSIKLLSQKQVIRLFKLSIPYYFESINILLKNSYQIIILGLFFNAQLVGIVSTFKTLFYFLPIKAWGIINNVFIYEFTKFYAQYKFNLLYKLYTKFIKLYCFSIVIFISISIFSGEFIYNLWLNNSYNFDYTLLLLIILDVSILSMAHYISIVNRAINNFFEVSLFAVLVNLCIILVTYQFFINEKNFYVLFILNLIGAVLMLFFNIYRSKKLSNKLMKISIK